MSSTNEPLLMVLKSAVLSIMRADGPDLSARQLGVLLTAALTEGPHTVRGLAQELGVSKPAITRALDRLEELRLARRKPDPTDRRSIHVMVTDGGRHLIMQIARAMNASAQGPKPKRMTLRRSTPASHH